MSENGLGCSWFYIEPVSLIYIKNFLFKAPCSDQPVCPHSSDIICLQHIFFLLGLIWLILHPQTDLRYHNRLCSDPEQSFYVKGSQQLVCNSLSEPYTLSLKSILFNAPPSECIWVKAEQWSWTIFLGQSSMSYQTPLKSLWETIYSSPQLYVANTS